MLKRARVVAALIYKDNKILIAQRPEKDPFALKWEFPGGKVKVGEDDRTALLREIEEELKVSVKIGKCVFEIDHDYPNLSVRLAFYWCEILGGRQMTPCFHRCLEWVSPKELEKYNFLEADQPVLKQLRRGFVDKILNAQTSPF